MNFHKVLGAGISFLSLTAFTSTSFAIDRTEVSSKVLYKAVNQLTDYFQHDLSDISKHTQKTAIVNFTTSEDLPPSIQHYLVKRLEMISQKDNKTPVQFVQCVECLSLHAVAEGDEIFIRKGITDDAQLRDTMSKLGINKYSDINLAYTGDELIMQVAVVDQNKLVDWSNEYKTPYKAYDDSQWELGAAVAIGTFQGKGNIPAAQGAKINFGQRLTGLGSVGIAVSHFQENPGVPAISNFGGYFGLSHNELFNQYWSYARLIYEFGVGMTDFNGNQLLHQSVGIKTILGKYYSVGINGSFTQFASAPSDDSAINNSKGEPYLNNNDPVPTMISLTIGAQLM